MTEKSKQAKNRRGQREVKISDHITGAEYANMMQVMYTREEFRLMFAHIFEPSGKVVGKVTTTPAHFKRMLNAMQESLERYEKENGSIQDIDSRNDSKIGFE